MALRRWASGSQKKNFDRQGVEIYGGECDRRMDETNHRFDSYNLHNILGNWASQFQAMEDS